MMKPATLLLLMTLSFLFPGESRIPNPESREETSPPLPLPAGGVDALDAPAPPWGATGGSILGRILDSGFWIHPQTPPREIKSPLTPEQAVAEFKLQPGLKVELVAAEPEVQSPVAAAFDEQGRLFVVEMLDYPNFDKTKPPQGRIKMLEDKDGDGRFETATVYAEGLLMAQGLHPWKGGLL